jgi:hypothetical protein
MEITKGRGNARIYLPDRSNQPKVDLPDRSNQPKVDGGITGNQWNGWTRKECFCRHSYSFLSAHSEEIPLAHFPFRSYCFNRSPPSSLIYYIYGRCGKEVSLSLSLWHGIDKGRWKLTHGLLLVRVLSIPFQTHMIIFLLLLLFSTQ